MGLAVFVEISLIRLLPSENALEALFGGSFDNFFA
jgi:hypothetical protein